MKITRFILKLMILVFASTGFVNIALACVEKACAFVEISFQVSSNTSFIIKIFAFILFIVISIKEGFWKRKSIL